MSEEKPQIKSTEKKLTEEKPQTNYTEQKFTEEKPKLNSTDTANDNLQFNIKDIKKYYKDQVLPDLEKLEGGKFTDPLFLPDKNSLMSLDPNTGNPIDQIQYDEDANTIPHDRITWKRANDIYPKCELFVDKIEAGDIMQGSLGNCYFLAAIAAMTEFPNLIHKIFKTDKLNQFGIYEIALFLDGEWQIVIIDDYLPYDPKYNSSAFTHSNGQELWVLMIEKAWAKVNGGYLNTIGGQAYDPLSAFTGFLSRCIKTSMDINELWSTLHNADENNYLMCIDSKEETPESIERNLCHLHAYTLIGTQEEKYNEKLIRLCKIRNPHGNKEWNGDWSDKSPLWNDDLKKKFGFKEFKEDEWNDGTFFISIEDVQKFFEGVHICSYMYGAKTKTLEIKKENFAYPSIFGLYLDKDDIDCLIRAIGQNWRFNRNLKGKSFPINLTIAKANENNLNELVYLDSCFSDSDPFIIKKLKKGFYIISVFYGPDDNDQRYLNDFNLKISSNSNFKLEFLTYDKDFKILNKIIKDGILKKESENINSEKVYYNADTFYSSGFGYQILTNKSVKNYIKMNLDPTDMFITGGYKAIPPLNNTNTTNLYCSPGQQKILLVFKTRDCGSFSFGFETETENQLKKPFDDDPEANQKSNENSSEYDFKRQLENMINNSILKDYYNYIAPELTDAKNQPSYKHTDIYEITKANLLAKYPEKMNLVLKLESTIDIKKLNGKYLWKFIPISNGYYLGEYLDKQGLLGRAIFTFDNDSYDIGTYKKNVREGYFEEYSVNGKLLFKGNYSNGKRNGQGTAYYEEGIYEGNFTENKKTGMGKYTFPKGCYYIGEFANNSFNGKGKFYFKENEYWEGNFIDNLRQGEGFYYFASGKKRNISFKDNKLI
jgi:calpain-15